jgi:hypothetical protein
MEWVQFIILIVAMGGMFFWNRTEARADARHFDQETKELRREMIDVMRGFQTSVDAIKEDGRMFREQWAAESKDFHGRLCSIAERKN